MWRLCAQLARNAGVRHLLRLTVNGLRDALRGPTRRPPHLVPVMGEPGSRAIIAKHGAEQDYTPLTGPSWRNEVCARTALEVAFNRPIRFAARVPCPLLVQAGTVDSITPPARARSTAAKAPRGRTAGISHRPFGRRNRFPRNKICRPVSSIFYVANCRRPRLGQPLPPPPIGAINEASRT